MPRTTPIQSMHDPDHKHQNLSNEPSTQTDPVRVSLPPEVMSEIFSELQSPQDHMSFLFFARKTGLRNQQWYYTRALEKRFNLTLGNIKEYIKNYFGQEIDEAESLLLSPKALYTVQDLFVRFPAPKTRNPSMQPRLFPEIFKYVKKLPKDYPRFPNMLEAACLVHNLELVKWLCEKSGLIFNPETVTGFAITNLHIVRYLIDKRILTPNWKTLHKNVDSSYPSVVQHLLQEQYNIGPIRVSAAISQAHNPSMVQFLLEKYPDIAPDEQTLDQAASLGKLSVVQFLLKKYPDIAPDEKTLNQAIHWGDLSLVRLLLDQYPNLAPTQKNVYTAAYQGHLPIVRFLLQNYPDLVSMPDHLRDLLYKADCSNNPLLIRFLLFLLNKYSVEFIPKKFLDITAHGGHLSLMQRLLKKSPNLVPDQNTLEQAVRSNSLPMARFLLENYPNLVPTPSALYYATLGESLPLVQLLYEKNPNLIPDQKTLSHAAYGFRLPILQYLCKKHPEETHKYRIQPFTPATLDPQENSSSLSTRFATMQL